MLSSIKLTIFFENPFWVGVFESTENNLFKVCKVTFGSEPKDGEVYYFILRKFYSLNFSNALSVDKNIVNKKINPKRLQRKIKKETNVNFIGTKSQIALKEQHKEVKTKRKLVSKEQKAEKIQRKFEIKQIKKLEKHKGH